MRTAIVSLSILSFVAACGPVQNEPGNKVGDDEVWYRTLGGAVTDEGWGIDTASNGDILIANFEGHPDILPDAYVYRLTPDGNDIVWTTHWAGPGGSTEQVFIVRSAGGIAYVGGTTYNDLTPESADALLLALDEETGALLWEFTYDQGYGYEEIDGIVVEADGIYVSGWTTGDGTGNDILLAKVTLDGQLDWVRTYGTDRWDEANGHLIADATHLYIAGREDADGFLTGGDSIIAAYDKTNGDFAWQTRWGDPNETEDALGLTTDGTRLFTVGLDGDDLDVRAFDKTGTELWAQSYGGAQGESARAIAVDPADGHLVVVGNTASQGAGGTDLAILRFDIGTGELLDEDVWGGAQDDQVHDFVIRGDRLYLNAQTMSAGAGGWDALVMAVGLDPVAWPPTP